MLKGLSGNREIAFKIIEGHQTVYGAIYRHRDCYCSRCFFYAGLVTYSNNLNTYTKDYFQKHNLSDLHVYYSQLSKNDVTRLSKIEGINKIEGRYTFDGTQTFEDYKTSIKIHSIPDNNEINTPTITEGSIPLKRMRFY